MNTTQTTKGENLISIKVTLNKADYEEKVNEQLKKFQHKANIPGFRVGKAPMGMIKKMYGPSVTVEEINRLVSDELNKHITDNKLNLIGYPLNDPEQQQPEDLETAEELNFFFEAGIRPEIKPDLGAIKMEFSKIIANEEEINKTIDSLIERNPIITHPEKIGDNDKIEAKICEAEDGQELEDGFKKTVHFGISQIKKTYRKQLLGKEEGAEFIFNFEKSAGEKEAKAILGEDAPIDSDYNIVINGITHEEKPELNEEFFNTIFPNQEVKDEETFRGKVKEEMEKQYEAETDPILFNKMIDKLIEEVKFNMPDSFVKRWIVTNSQGKVTDEEMEKNYESNYAKGIRWQLIEDSIVKDNMDLVVKDEELRDFVAHQIFPGTDLNTLDENTKEQILKIADNYLKREDQQERLRNQMADVKMTRFLKEKMNIKYKETTYEAFLEQLKKDSPKPKTKKAK